MSEPLWEYCEVDLEARGGGIKGLFGNMAGFYYARFVAMGIGPRGRYKVAETPEFKHRGINEDMGKKWGEDALSDIAGQLVRDGWEPLPTTGTWYGLRFRRRAK